MTVVIMQPGYLPWLGFFELMYKSDIFVIYDNVQYDKNSWRNRNRIKTLRGVQWLTVPVLSSGKPLIKDTKIDNKQDWRRKHLKSIKINYRKAPFLKKYIGLFEDMLAKEWEFLLDLDMAFINEISKTLGLRKKLIYASELNVTEKDKIKRLIGICQLLKADIFYEPAGGKNYLAGEEKKFEGAGIKLIFQNYKHPVYSQLHGDFVPNLSIIDLLFNEGPKSLDIIIKNK